MIVHKSVHVRLTTVPYYSGFTYYRGPSHRTFLPTNPCQRTVAPNSTTRPTNNTMEVPTVVQSIYIHEAVVVQWRKHETKDFPFSVPNMASPTFVHTWTPGSTLQDYDGGSGSSNSSGLGGGMIALIVVCTIVGFIVFIGLLCCARHAIEPKEGSRNRAPPGPGPRSGTELDELKKKTQV